MPGGSCDAGLGRRLPVLGAGFRLTKIGPRGLRVKTAGRWFPRATVGHHLRRLRGRLGSGSRFGLGSHPGHRLGFRFHPGHRLGPGFHPGHRFGLTSLPCRSWGPCRGGGWPPATVLTLPGSVLTLPGSFPAPLRSIFAPLAPLSSLERTCLFTIGCRFAATPGLRILRPPACAWAFSGLGSFPSP
jgi:hypothetical protein